MHVQTQEIAEQRVPAVAQADGFQAGKQSALLFIEQAIEQQDGGLEFIRRCLELGGMDGHRNGLSAAPGEHCLRRGTDSMAVYRNWPATSIRAKRCCSTRWRRGCCTSACRASANSWA